MMGIARIGLIAAATLVALTIGAAVFVGSGVYNKCPKSVLDDQTRHQDERDAGLGQEPG